MTWLLLLAAALVAAGVHQLLRRHAMEPVESWRPGMRRAYLLLATGVTTLGLATTVALI